MPKVFLFVAGFVTTVAKNNGDSGGEGWNEVKASSQFVRQRRLRPASIPPPPEEGRFTIDSLKPRMANTLCSVRSVVMFCLPVPVTNWAAQ